jgi:hypothetical protein
MRTTALFLDLLGKEIDQQGRGQKGGKGCGGDIR